jgi:hypothetical protein
MKEMNEIVGEYRFFTQNLKLFVEIDNGILIDFEKLNIEALSLYTEKNNWVVSFITLESINKLKLGVDEKLTIPGLVFSQCIDAIKTMQILCNFLLKGTSNEQSNKREQ